ncbi:hypothetical protein GJV85_05885 [Sulfurimonas aquatica]|uniref:Uncharacterized protein n=1 Tax=Sulfurimonas aquatica TaxID=2672570 RepID=A0A975AZX7_9BACT|nr:hypothetical protein [Sulfurimonas aquatica]QSZ41654.1 hypothetical protein GJV85_05885 [Sulfurimonas aquatica]
MKIYFVSSLLLMCLSLTASIVPVTLPTGTAVVPNDKDYYTDTTNNVEIIYTKDNIPFAKHTSSVETPLNESYKKFFNWELDETLYVGLISDYNQIANGFSTQWPNNRQINYVGGSQMVDYFTTTSWLDTLLYHETAHNYQLNIKGSVVSRVMHSIFGNGTVFIPFPFGVPNVLENSFMLEGNAVLNESWHGNGGRLYSGRFKAQTLLQAKAGKIKPEYVYNSKLEFPYGERAYIQGGFFNLYLAQKYGIERVNSYFKFHSEDWWFPAWTDASMRDAIGVSFTQALSDFESAYASAADYMQLANGKKIASSQFFSSLGNDSEEIFFITNESGYRAPELVVVDKKEQSVKKRRDSWMNGKVVKQNGEYFTQGSRNTSPTRIYQGLFNSNAFIKEGSESKMVQGYLSDGREVYFDVPTSYSEPQLYVGAEFYAKVNSSVIIDKYDNLYYFKQNGKKRTLYKNKKALYTYEGFYGMVSDVDSRGIIYFVANSRFGSSLFTYYKGMIRRATEADNVVEARLINDNEVLIAAMSDKDYYYVINDINRIKETPYETKLFFEEKEYYESVAKQSNENTRTDAIELASDSYYSVLEMNYSGADFAFGYGSVTGPIGSLDIKFGDPLSQSSATAFVRRDELNVTIAGVEFSSSEYLLNYRLLAYKVLDEGVLANARDVGFVGGLTLPFYNAGYYNADIGVSYYQDYSEGLREPLSLSLRAGRSEGYGVSMYANYENMLQLYGVSERKSKLLGGQYRFSHDLPYQFYLGLGAKYSHTQEESVEPGSGVKISNLSFAVDLDPSTISMPNLDGSFYAKSVGYGEVSLSKVFNFSAYFFTFPVSLQRESFYAKYRYYDVQYLHGGGDDVNEYTAGLMLGTVFLNSFVAPLSFEYVHNDTVVQKDLFRFLLGVSF